jgi:hypothetical protein
VLFAWKRYTPKAETASTASNTATSAMYNHRGRLFCTGVAGVGNSTEWPGRVVGIGVLAETAGGVCITGADPVGVTGKTGVELGMTGDGGRAGVLLPATIGGAVGAFDSDCCCCWLGYVGLFIVSKELLIPLKDGGLTVPGDG